jgi:hypothetical protein
MAYHNWAHEAVTARHLRIRALFVYRVRELIRAMRRDASVSAASRNAP